MAETHSLDRRLVYARVSTCGQTLNAQLEQLCGVDCSKIYRAKVTGAHNRCELLKMLAALAPGDVAAARIVSPRLKVTAYRGKDIVSENL